MRASVLALGAAVAGFMAVIANLYGPLRALGALAMFGAIFYVGARKMEKVVSVPPEAEVTDVSEYGLRYVCTMCGLELKVEVAARDKAPTHCGESMVLMRTGGKAPLRPV
ncbi:MAG: hypothetical protein M3345_03080 [Actinomycetota bacterium]|nr:hypothetical protein [Actinomycetota bacterium]